MHPIQVLAALALLALGGCLPLTMVAPAGVQAKAAEQLVPRCAYMTHAQRMADRRTFYQSTRPHLLAFYCQGDPDFPAGYAQAEPGAPEGEEAAEEAAEDGGAH